jgi:site-specific DNA-methyltransferase (adenine-specific)
MSYLLAVGRAEQLPFADRSIDLIIGSPNYQNARLYLEDGQDLGIACDCDEWVQRMMRISREAVRVSRGMVLWVLAGKTDERNYLPGPEMLMAEWYRSGGYQECPCYWRRVGIAGSGGSQWYRKDVEYVLAFKAQPNLPWADLKANGHPCVYTPGGAMSHRLASGIRRNQFGAGVKSNQSRGADGKMRGRPRSGHRVTTAAEAETSGGYQPPARANPGNCILGIPVGGGLLGHDLAHENEAPFPQRLAEWFIRSHCPVGGLVLDPFSGSGTTVAAALRLGRRGIGLDIRLSHARLAKDRVEHPQAPKQRRRKPWASLSPDNGWRSLIASRIRAMGWSYGRLGRESGVDPAVVQRYVKGERDVTAATAERLCEALGLLVVPREQLAAMQYEPPCPTGEDEGHGSSR